MNAIVSPISSTTLSSLRKAPWRKGERPIDIMVGTKNDDDEKKWRAIVLRDGGATVTADGFTPEAALRVALEHYASVHGCTEALDFLRGRLSN